MRFLPYDLEEYYRYESPDSLSDHLLDAGGILSAIDKLKGVQDAMNTRRIRDLIKKLDSMFELPDNKVVEELRKWIRVYLRARNSWHPSLELTIQIYDSPRNVGEKVYDDIEERYGEDFEKQVGIARVRPATKSMLEVTIWATSMTPPDS